MGENQNPKKSRGLPTKAKKTSPKKSHAKIYEPLTFPGSIITQEINTQYANTTKNLETVLKRSPKNPYLNQVTPRKDLPNFPSQKNPGIEISNQKNPSIILVT